MFSLFCELVTVLSAVVFILSIVALGMFLILPWLEPLGNKYKTWVDSKFESK